MFGELMKKYKEKFFCVKDGNKKITEYLITLLIIGIVIIIGANIFSGNEQKKSTKEEAYIPTDTSSKTQDNDPNYKLEQRLAKMLSEISGVGKVSVLVTFASGPETVIAKDETANQTNTKERDTSGGQRVTVQNELETKMVMTDEQNGQKDPVVLKQLTSRILGVVVAADGGDKPAVKANIISAVEAATGVGSYKVQVFKRQ